MNTGKQILIKLNFFTGFRQNTEIPSFIKIRLVREELFHADRWTHRQTDRQRGRQRDRHNKGRKFANPLNRDFCLRRPPFQ